MYANAKPGRVLTIAGSDPSGGAGIQADIKTVTALGGYAMTAVTALTAQNTTGVYGVIPVANTFIAEQMRLVLDDIGADCLKTGMLHNSGVIETVIGVLDSSAQKIPLVVDPVMYAKGGHPLLEVEAINSLRKLLVPRATIVTPNIPEAEALVGIQISDVNDMRRAGEAVMLLGAEKVLIKGGHLEGDNVTDVLVTKDGIELFYDNRIDTIHTHGTGCTLASALATGIANGLSVRTAVEHGRSYVRGAILAAPEYGSGRGPLDHGHLSRNSRS